MNFLNYIILQLIILELDKAAANYFWHSFIAQEQSSWEELF